MWPICDQIKNVNAGSWKFPSFALRLREAEIDEVACLPALGLADDRSAGKAV